MISYKNPLIFIVEDEPSFQKLIEKSLKSHHFNNVEIYSSGEDCLKAIETKKPDIVLQDYDLGGINGLETMIAVKSKYPDTEFLFLSGQTSIKVAVDALRKGAFDYVVKGDNAYEIIIYRLNRVLKIAKLEAEKKALQFGKFIFFGVLMVFLIIIYILIKLEVLLIN